MGKGVDASRFRIDDDSDVDTLRQRAAERRRATASESKTDLKSGHPVTSKAVTGDLKRGTRPRSYSSFNSVVGVSNNAGAATRRYIPRIWEDIVAKFVGLSGTSIRVFLHLWQQSAMEGEQTVTLTNVGLKKFKIDHRRKPNALRQLETAGLIRVEWRRNRNPLVTLLEPA